MAELDSLIGSRISLISLQDIRYDGILFSINASESSLVLRDVRTLGTEDRQTEKVVAASSAVIPYVSFPGGEIKDLYVHENQDVQDQTPPPTSALPTPPQVQASSNAPPAVLPQQKSVDTTEKKSKSAPKPAQNTNKPAAEKVAISTTPETQPKVEGVQQKYKAPSSSSAGTGEHLLKMRERKFEKTGANNVEDIAGEFDFAQNLSSFKKEEVFKKVVEENAAPVTSHYVKDDFFDSLSSTDGKGRNKMSAGEERLLNQDTFGAIALQSGYRGRHGGRGYGGGRGGGRGYQARGEGGAGRAPSGGRGRGGGGQGWSTGRGGGHNENTVRNENSPRAGRGKGSGGGRGDAPTKNGPPVSYVRKTQNYTSK